MKMDSLFALIMLIASPVIFLISLFVLIIYEDAEKRKKAKNGLLISLALLVIGFSTCLSSI